MNKVAEIYNAVPVGTYSIMLVSNILYIINIFTSWPTNHLSLTSNAAVHNLFTQLPTLITNQVVFASFWHQLVATILFPFAASGFESEVGTIAFLHLFVLQSVMVSILYVVVIYAFSFLYPEWLYFQLNGLDIAFFTFLTIEALNGRGLYEISSKFRKLNIPRELYSLPFFALLAVILPHQSWFGHLFAIIIGYFYYLDILSPFLLSEQTILSIESSGIMRWFSSRPTFMIKPGNVHLPTGSGAKRSSFVEQVVGTGSDSYTAISTNENRPLLTEVINVA